MYLCSVAEGAGKNLDLQLQASLITNYLLFTRAEDGDHGQEEHPAG